MKNLGINGYFVTMILGLTGMIFGASTLIGLVCSLILRESQMTSIFLLLSLIYIIAGFFVMRLSRSRINAVNIKIREGVLAVTLVWVFAAVLGAVPYLMAGSHDSFIGAFFESTACITTTGSTLVDNLMELPKSLLFWRQITTWFGGLGIIIFAVTIIPMLGFGASSLVSNEMPSQSIDKIRSSVSSNVKRIFLIFMVFTGIEILLLAGRGMSLYNAILLSFSSVGTGGFVNYNVGGMLDGSIYVDVVVGIFCILASLSFVSYQLLLKRRTADFFRETEIRLFFIVAGVICAAVLIILFSYNTYETAQDTFRFGVIQTISFITTAGYSGADVDIWPQAANWILIAAMIIGGCSGSTSSGIKVVRFAVIIQIIRRNIYKRLHPNAVVAVKLGDRTVPEERVSSITTFVTLYAMIVLISCFALSFENLDTGTTLGTVMAMMSNTGLVIGPSIGFCDTLAGFSQFSYLYMSLLMLAGRLELFTIVLLLSPAFWRRTH